MKDVEIIKARNVLSSRARTNLAKRLRVAAYCRVSTDSEDQLNSYKSQVQHYTDLIKSKSEWDLAGIYADEAITGTQVTKREDFQRLINDCMNGDVDMIITKSISRFARNTLDTLKYVRMLKEKGIAEEVIGVDNSENNRNKALELKLVDRFEELHQAVKDADLIVLATPVDSIPMLAVKALNLVNEKQVVIDMGSTKQELSEIISQHPRRGRFVATHPMWGTEYSGPEAAKHGAFIGRTVVICDHELSDPDALALVEWIYNTIGMPIKYMSSEEQDTHTAYVSHISHITSFALALTVLEKEREEEHIFDLAGGGFESTVRLAKSSPDTWIPIFKQNKYNVLDVLREHIHQLQIFRRMIERDDTEGLRSMMLRANSIKRILK